MTSFEQNPPTACKQGLWDQQLEGVMGISETAALPGLSVRALKNSSIQLWRVQRENISFLAAEVAVGQIAFSFWLFLEKHWGNCPSSVVDGLQLPPSHPSWWKFKSINIWRDHRFPLLVLRIRHLWNHSEVKGHRCIPQSFLVLLTSNNIAFSCTGQDYVQVKVTDPFSVGIFWWRVNMQKSSFSADTVAGHPLYPWV